MRGHEGWRVVGAALLAVLALSCRGYDFHGAKCDPADGRCPGGYVCAVHRDFPERGNRCIFEAEAQQADAGVDAGGDAGGDAGTDAGADAGAGPGADAGTDAGGPPDSGTDAGTDAGSDAGADAGTDADAGGDAGAGAGQICWGTSTLIETSDLGSAWNPQVSVDPAGNAIAVWSQSDGAQWHIWANRFSAVTFSWADAGRIDVDNAADATGPHIAIDPAGNAVVVWQIENASVRWNHFNAVTGFWEDAGVVEVALGIAPNASSVAVDPAGNAIAVWEQGGTVYSSRYIAATTTWTDAGRIAADPGVAYQPKVAVDPAGNATAVWYQSDGTYFSIYSNRFAVSAGRWADAGRIEGNVGDAYGPTIAVDPEGNAVVVWYQWAGTGYHINSNRFTARTGAWGDAGGIEQGTGSFTSPAVSGDSAGNVTAVWGSAGGPLYSSRYNPTTGFWGDAGIVGYSQPSSALPNVAASPRGDAVAIWVGSDDGIDSIFGNRYQAATASWGDPRLAEMNAGVAATPVVAIDPAGNAVAVWRQTDGFRYSIWANVCRVSPAQKSWGDAGIVGVLDAGDATAPHVAIDPAGNATVAWSQNDGTSDRIFVRRYTAATGSWGSAEPVNVGWGHSPKVAVAPSGTATVVWQQWDGTPDSIFANRFTLATGQWSDAGLIDRASAGGSAVPEVAVSPSGDAVAIWLLKPTGLDQSDLWGNRYSAATGLWGDAGPIAPDAGGDNADYPRVAVDPAGNVIVVWSKWVAGGAKGNVYATRWSAAAGAWGTSLFVGASDAGDGRASDVAFDPAGNATVVWYEYAGALPSVWSRRYVAAGASWTAATLVENETGYNVAPRVAVDPAGNAVVVWVWSSSPDNRIFANRWSAATGRWGDAGAIDSVTTNSACQQVATDSSGNAIAVWCRMSGGFLDIWTNRYDAVAGRWGDAGALESGGAGSSFEPQIAMNSAGNTVVVWKKSDGGVRSNIWARVYR